MRDFRCAQSGYGVPALAGAEARYGDGIVLCILVREGVVADDGVMECTTIIAALAQFIQSRIDEAKGMAA